MQFFKYVEYQIMKDKKIYKTGKNTEKKIERTNV